MIDSEQLRQFLSVARHMNLTKAANDMYISHSTVSRNISKLEEQFGVQLMMRTNRSVSLTPAGQYLAREGEKILGQLDRLETDMAQFRTQNAAHLHISMFNFYNNDIFRRYEQFHRANPGVDMSIRYRPPEGIPADILEGRADIGITFSFALADTSKFETLPILDGEFVVIVSSAHPLAKRISISIDDPEFEQPLLIRGLDYPFVTTVGQDALFHQLNLPPREVDSLEAMILQIKANMGIAIIPEHAATQIGAGCSLLSLDGVDSTYQIVMFWQKHTKNPAVRTFLDGFRHASD